ncbi:cytochrome b-c1 complex subunit 7-like [Ylistrum balloti]|uniref:cytochrome b-c1 complex subunit 7-like n=1 Tax=Ylistrum balloti TaxID=509963 RepID=UPI00290599BC|nr:cytochrome b-c1 complex subunit 7-like [Ylistrum balloti]
MSTSAVSRIASLVVKSKESSLVQKTKNFIVAVGTPPRRIRKIYSKFMYYPQLGVYRDDCTKRNFYGPGVLNESVQRLPSNIQRERQFRINRALSKSGSKTVLSRKLWVRSGEEVRYIDSAINTVVNDIETKKFWDLNGEAPANNYTLSPEEYQAGLENVVRSMESSKE